MTDDPEPATQAQLAEPATEAQLEYLRKLNVPAPRGLTKSAAIDLIGSKLPPEEETVEILRSFQVDTSGMTQTDARYALKRLMENPANRERSRRQSAKATTDQKAILSFFGQPIPPGLSHRAADKIIAEIFTDTAKAEAWDAEQRRLDRIASVRVFANDFAGGCGCHRLSAKLVHEAFASLTRNGLTIEQIEADDYARLFARAAEIDPTVVRRRDKFECFVLEPLRAKGSLTEVARERGK
jgi:hypothetical protein